MVVQYRPVNDVEMKRILVEDDVAAFRMWLLEWIKTHDYTDLNNVKKCGTKIKHKSGNYGLHNVIDSIFELSAFKCLSSLGLGFVDEKSWLMDVLHKKNGEVDLVKSSSIGLPETSWYSGESFISKLMGSEESVIEKWLDSDIMFWESFFDINGLKEIKDPERRGVKAGAVINLMSKGTASETTDFLTAAYNVGLIDYEIADTIMTTAMEMRSWQYDFLKKESMDSIQRAELLKKHKVEVIRKDTKVAL